MGNFAKQMKLQAEDFDRVRQENRERRNQSRGAPEGTHQMKITDAVIEQGTKGGLADRWYYRMMFRVVGGKHDGVTHEKFGFLDSPKNGRNVPLSILIGDLDTLGIEASPETLEDDIREAIGNIVQVTVKPARNAPDQMNTYVNGLIRGNGSVDRASRDDDSEDEDSPKRRGRPKGSKNKPKSEPEKPRKQAPPPDEEEGDEDEFDAFLADDED